MLFLRFEATFGDVPAADGLKAVGLQNMFASPRPHDHDVVPSRQPSTLLLQCFHRMPVSTKENHTHATRNFGWRYADGAEVPNEAAHAISRRSGNRLDRKAPFRTLSPITFKRSTTQRSNPSKWESGSMVPMMPMVDQMDELTRIVGVGKGDRFERVDSVLSGASTAPASAPRSPASNRAHDFSAVIAADWGTANAQCDLGWMYAKGTGVEKDTSEAVRLYRLASNQGHARAQLNLGVIYATGTGVPKDVREAAQLFRRAAEQGHARAQCNLGCMYEIGMGVPRDANEAVRLYRLAANQGHERAQIKLGVIMLLQFRPRAGD
jgi:TPR repeat protein